MRRFILNPMNILLVIAAAAVLIAGAALGDSAPQKDNVKLHDKLAIGEEEVKQLLLLMDTDKNGKISKHEYMRFMEQEFDRLDVDKSGELDTKELTQSKLRVSHFSHAGK